MPTTPPTIEIWSVDTPGGTVIYEQHLDISHGEDAE